jgi:hypothetical protein
MILADKQGAETPDWHKAIVEERLEAYNKNPENLISLEDLKASIEKMK